MSKRPLGPWARSQGSIALTPKTGLQYSRSWSWGYPYKEWSSPTVIVPIGFKTTRSGYNSGPDHSTPRPASCTVQTDKFERGWSARAKHPTKDDYLGSVNRPWRPGEHLGSFEPTDVINSGKTLSEVRDLAFRKFIQRQGPEFQGLVFVGEGREMLETCRDAVNRATGAHNAAYQSLVKNLLKRKKGSVSDLAREIADHNLGLQFALLPSITDLKDLALSIQDKAINDSFPRMSVEASYADRSNAAKEAWANYGFQLKLKNRCSWFKLAKYGASVKQSLPTAPDWVSNLEYFGFSPRDIVPALWELTPYSWLVDYFSNIGDLMDLASLRRGTFELGWQVSIDTYSLECTAYPSHYDSYYTQVSGRQTGLFTREYFSFTRSSWDPSTHVPSVRVKVPNYQQAANVLSLGVKKLVRSPINQVLPLRVANKVGREVRRILV